MRKGRDLFNNIFVFCLVSGMMVCFGIESLGADPSRDALIVAQGSPSQPTDSATPQTPTVPQPSTTQPPALPQPQPVPPTYMPSPAPAPSGTSVSPPSTTTPSPSPPTPQPLQRRRMPPLTQRPNPQAPQPPSPATQPPSLPAQGRPPVPTPGPGQTPVLPGPPPPPTAPPSQASVTRTDSGVIFNFDNADIYEVIRVVSEIMKINYIIDPRVKGVVNIHTSGQIASADVFPIFQSILRLNGATAVKRDGVYEIVPLPEAKKLPFTPSLPRDLGKPVSEERYIIQILPLKYIPVTEVSKMIKPFLSDGADIVEHLPNNILIIGDLASNVKKSVDIISLFDIDIFTELRVRIYPITNADVNEVAKEMERVFASFEISTKSGRGIGITFTPVIRINSLLVVSSIPNIFEKVEGWLKELDKIPTKGTKYSVFVYYVQNMKAKDLGDVLKQVFGAAKDKKADFKEKVTAAEYPRGIKPIPSPPPATTAPPAAKKEEEGAVPEGEINIVVDETNNALVVRAFARDYKSILDTIKKLDVYPKQVLIETFLADITLDDTYKFGIEWAKFVTTSSSRLQGEQAQGVVAGMQPPTDLFNAAMATGSYIRYSIVELGGRISAAVNAAAADNRLNIISSPHILASNNKEAKIQIGTSEPILTNTYTTTSTSTIGVVEGTIEYKDVGIILTVTPRISDAGLITLEIQIEKSDAATKDVFGRTDVPYFDKKTAKTTVSVLEGQTIVIGGLIEDTRKRNKSGVPLLSKIPILGALFGVHDLQNKKRELVLLMTPHIITDHIQSSAVTDEFKEKVEGLKKELEKERKKKEKK
jgi:general secretion pathway protein D